MPTVNIMDGTASSSRKINQAGEKLSDQIRRAIWKSKRIFSQPATDRLTVHPTD